MKSTLTLVVLLAGFIAIQVNPLHAQEAPQSVPQDKTFGAGLMLGEPTGASFKYWLSEESAIDGLVGVSWYKRDHFTIHADYLYHLNDVIELSENRMPIYLGVGPRFKAQDPGDDIFGIRTVAGVDYIFDDIPVDVFFEAGPVFDFTPDVDIRYTVGVGARFWF